MSGSLPCEKLEESVHYDRIGSCMYCIQCDSENHQAIVELESFMAEASEQYAKEDDSNRESC